jgi:hypothetical protein
LAWLSWACPIDKRPQVLAFEERRNDEQLMSRNVSSILAFNQILFGSNGSMRTSESAILLDNISNLVSGSNR